MRQLLLSIVIAGLAFAAFGKTDATFAHEIVTVGPYQFEIGWLEEPALAGEKNAVWISAVKSQTGEPVLDISTVNASIAIGGRSKDLLFRPLAEDKPGQYAADLIPTVRGVYTLQLQGKLPDQRVEVSVDLDEVEAASNVQFPEPFPSTIELQKRLAAIEGTTTFTRLVATIAFAVSLVVVIINFAGTIRKPKP